MKRFWSLIFGRQPEAPAVRPDERLTRYIFQKDQFKKGEVKAAAFLPAGDGTTSVFRTSEVAEEGIWDIGVNHVETIRRQKNPKITLKARGDVRAGAAIEQELAIVPEMSLHPLHADLSGWPPEESAQLLVAVELARHATLCLRP